MRRNHSPCLEDLEARKLLSTARGRLAARLAAAAPALVLDGTLGVDNARDGTSTAVNADGGSTTSVIVMGTLSGLGNVQGTWSETVDANGVSEGPDSLRLRTASGTLVVAIADANPSRPIAAGHGAAYTEYSQVLMSATGPYAGAAEKGSIELFSARARGPVTGLVLHTKGT